MSHYSIMAFALTIPYGDLAMLAQAAARLSSELSAPLLVRVMGSLGAGKTTLITTLLAQWGVQGANSPTFNLRHDYALPDLRVLHLDLYRLHSADTAWDLLPSDEDYSDAIVFVEWPEKAPPGLFQPFSRQAELKITILDDNARHLEFSFL